MTGLRTATAIALTGVLSASAVAPAQEPGAVRVNVAEDRVYGRVAYKYSVENNHRTRSIVALRIGEDGREERAELRQPPFGWSDEKGLPIGSAFAPDGWTVEAIREDEHDLWFVEWFSSDADETLEIAPGEMRDGFGLIVFDRAPEYLSSHWTVVFDDGGRLSGRIARDDR